jgi:DNA-binding response OmpR family regulator
MVHARHVDVLVVEDDAHIAEPLIAGLRRFGFAPTWVTTATGALQAADPRVVLLDLALPDMDGLEVCRRLRAESDVPILVITARGEEIDRVALLETGADDYLVKPFGFRELVARIRAVLRRTTPSGDPQEEQRIGALSIDRRRHKVSVDGIEIPLTPKEFDLLAALAEEPGIVLTRQQLLEQVWDPHWYGPTKTIDVHVASLRKKLGDAAWIETVRGVGLRLGRSS